MKKIILFLFSFIILIPIINAEDITPKSTSSILIEASTGKVLYEKDADKKLAPASMTKVMTMLIVMEKLENNELSLDDKVRISKNAASMGGSQIFIGEGENVKVDDLLKGITIASANDAAVALAEAIGGTEKNFVSMMNKRAKKLNLKNTTFKNPHGLDEEGHLTTARDLSIISRELVRHEKILNYTKTYEEYMTKKNNEKFWLVNTNKLVRTYKGMDGLKTGYTPLAGYGMIGTINKNGMRLISVVMKSPSLSDRSTETVGLLEYGYSLYNATTLIKKDKPVETLKVLNGNKRNIKVFLKDDVKYISKKGNKNIKYKKDIKLKDLKAPIKKNKVVGYMNVLIENNNYKYDLVIKEDIKKAGYFKTILNNLKMISSGNFN